MTITRYDPENYARNAVPHKDLKSAQENLSAFYEAINDARNKYRVVDVAVVVAMNITQKGKTGRALSTAYFGDGQEAEGMLSYALGEVQNSRRDMFKAIRNEETK